MTGGILSFSGSYDKRRIVICGEMPEEDRQGRDIRRRGRLMQILSQAALSGFIALPEMLLSVS